MFQKEKFILNISLDALLHLGTFSMRAVTCSCETQITSLQ